MTQPVPASESGEVEILEKVARGEPAAFARLYDLFAPRVYGLVVKLVGRSGPEADDLLQDVMFELWRNAAKYNPGAGSPATWILLITRSRVIDHVRKRRTAAGALDTLAARGQPDAEPRGTGSDTSDTRVMWRALENLPPEQAEAFTLAFARGMTREQIARSLDVPVGTVKTRVRAAVQRLARTDAGPGRLGATGERSNA